LRMEKIHRPCTRNLKTSQILLNFRPTERITGNGLPTISKYKHQSMQLKPGWKQMGGSVGSTSVYRSPMMVKRSIFISPPLVGMTPAYLHTTSFGEVLSLDSGSLAL